MLMCSNNSAQLKAGAILSYAQTFVSVAISLIYTPVMLSLLGKEGYGLYSIAAATISYVNLLNLGFSSSYVRFYARCKAANDELGLAKTNGLFCIVFCAIALLALLAGIVLCLSARLIFGNGLTDSEYATAKVIMLILTFSTAYDLGTSVFSSIITAHERFVFQKTVNLLKTVIGPSVTWLLLLCGYRSIMMATVSAALTMVVDTCYLVYCVRTLKIKINICNPHIGQLREIATFSGFIALCSVADQINWSVDKLILGRFRGAAFTAVYSVAAQLNMLYMQISTAISSVFIPKVNRMVAEHNSNSELTDIFIKIGHLQLLILLPIILGFVFFGRSFIEIWAPAGYEDAYPIMLLLMVPATVPYIQNVGIAIQTAENKHKFRAFLYIAMAVVNFSISIVLCKKYGGIGCAVGTAISIIIANGVIMNIHYHKAIGLDIIRFWKSMLGFLPAAIGTAAVGFCIMRWVKIDSYPKLFAWAAAFCVIYAALVWCKGMNIFEKQTVCDLLNKLVLKKPSGGAHKQ